MANQISSIFIVAFLLIACNKKTSEQNRETFKVIQSVINYQNSKSYNSADVFPKSRDTIAFIDYETIDSTAAVLKIDTIRGFTAFSINENFTQKTSFDQFIGLNNLESFKDQLTKNKIKLDTNQLTDIIPNNQITYDKQLPTPFLNNSKGLMVISNPLFNLKKDTSVIGYIYYQKPFQIKNFLRLTKDNSTSEWAISKYYGIVTKEIQVNDTTFSTVFIGSINRHAIREK